MREYSKISPKFWIGPTGKKLRTYGLETQLVALYLLTSPHANMIGLFYLPIAFMAHETGLGFEGASKGLTSAIEAGFCHYDEATEMVWVVEMAAYQIGTQLKQSDNQVKGVHNEYANIPENPYLVPFYERYKDAFFLTKKRGNPSPLEPPSKPLRSQEQEQEQEQEKEQGGAAATHSTENVDHSTKNVEKPAAADSVHVRAIELVKLLYPRGVQLTASHVNVRQWATDGVTDAQALTALEAAQAQRSKTGSKQPINSGFLTVFIAEQRAPPRQKIEQFDPVAYVNRERISLRKKRNDPDTGEVIDGTAIRL